MAKISTADFRAGMKVEVEGQPYTIVANEFVRPGKGQAFNRVKLKHLMTQRTIERTFKSGEMVEEADVVETQMRLLYKDHTGATFMNDTNFEQVSVDSDKLTNVQVWLKEDILYAIVFYKGEVVSVDPPTFMELKITETAPGDRGNTASGRVLKPAIVETGAKVQIPIFIEQDEIVKIDTRTGDYVARASK